MSALPDVAVLDAAGARALTDEIKADAAALWAKLLEAYDGKAHIALGYSSWGAYYEAEFKQTGTRGYQILDAAKVVAIQPGLNERQARELAPLCDEPEVLQETWAEVVDLHGDKPTAAQVKEVVDAKRPTAALMVQSAENEWYTPARYIEHARAVLGAIDLDPASCPAANQTVRAAKFYSVKVDGLRPEWSGRVWLNPPYGRLAGDFTRKLLNEYAAGRVSAAVVLVNAHCTDTSWFGGLWDHALCFTDHRIDFDSGERGKDSSSTHGSVFAYLGPDPAKFADIFSAFGAVVSRWSA